MFVVDTLSSNRFVQGTAMTIFIRRMFVFFAIILLPGALNGAASGPHKTICLNMIVKDESAIITRCLESMVPIIDYWVIVDTGSTDGTQQIIKDYMAKKAIPGELIERPWKNFAHNRNEAIDLAKSKADYLFFMDADDYIVYEKGFALPDLDKDFYYVTIRRAGTRYDRIHMVGNNREWKYVGVLHEVICPPADATSGTLSLIYNQSNFDGARAKATDRYLKDAETLEMALLEEPNNQRYRFYLAQSYRDAGKRELALEHYQKRAEMGGWDQEVFWSWLEVARAQEALAMPPETVLASYKRAFASRPSRIEPLYYIALHYRMKNEYEKAYQVAKLATTLPPAQDQLFVQQWMYDWGMPLELSIAAYWTDRVEECQQISQDLLKKELDPNLRRCVENNLGFANSKILEKLIAIPATPSPVGKLEAVASQ
jgi:glycosyltransferase involved in cell wall biosynthesis